MLGRAHAQPFLDRRIEVADRDAAHGNWDLTYLHDFIVIDDCDDVKSIRSRSDPRRIL
jgi:hypothetical protein